MSIKRLLVTGALLATASLLLLAILLFITNAKQSQLYESQVERYSSYLLADELRQSSDDLTRLARTYVMTGDDKYEEMYWDILAIRNGDKDRPVNMERIYWDLVLQYGDKPREDGARESLQSLMEKSGFTEQEFKKLTEAQQNSDGLVTTETIAMNAIKGLYDNGSGQYTRKATPDPEMARSIMHNDQYHKDKAKIMQPVNEFLRLLDERTLSQVENKKSEVLFYQNLFIASIIFAFLIFSASFFFIYKGIMKQIGGEPKSVIASMHLIAKGDLVTAVSDSHKNKKGLAQGLSLMGVSLNETISNVKDSANEVALAAQELLAVSEQTNQNINQQFSEVEQVATAMNEMSSTVSEVAQSAEDTSESVENANKQVSTVNNVVDHVIENIRLLSDEVTSISSVIQELQTESNNIGTVLNVIGEIADQTNLLALNAAIEAARAGEHGRGFAVVADEVRTLASRTQTSTSEIHEIITSLQNGAERATQAVQKGLDRVSTTVSDVESAGENLGAIATSVAQISDKSMMIASASSEQQSVAEEINQNLTRINQVAGDTAQGSNQLSDASQRLNELATELQSQVANFTTK